MDANLQAFIFREGGKLVSSVIGLVSGRPRKAIAQQEPSEDPRPANNQFAKIEAGPPVVTNEKSLNPARSKIQLPTREETREVLKRRLARELYKAELDLTSRLLINGKPCDCFSDKHTLGFEAMIEEIQPYEPQNSVYDEILQWLNKNQHKVSIEAIAGGKYKEEYPAMAMQFKEFRKQVMGTLSSVDKKQEGSVSKPVISLEDAKKMAAEEAMRAVEKEWNEQSSEKTA